MSTYNATSSLKVNYAPSEKVESLVIQNSKGYKDVTITKGKSHKHGIRYKLETANGSVFITEKSLPALEKALPILKSYNMTTQTIS